MHLNFNKISYAILMLFPFGILAGSFFVNLFVFLVVIFFITSLLINKNINFFYNHSYLFLFILSCLITSFSSNYIFHSLKKTLAFSAELIFLWQFFCIF